MAEPRETPRPDPSIYASHSRHWRENLYVYPVISRRSNGLSVGVNLNPDKACNFDCVYCQVDRATPPTARKVDLEALRLELDQMASLAVSGALFEELPFGHVPPALRRFNDIAFSGDGEPTASPQFPGAVEVAAEIRKRYQLDDVKLVLITDSTYLTKPKVREALATMDANNGEIWAKLDAGTQVWFELINRPNVPLATILDSILQTARLRPIVIQSLWMNVRGEAPPDAEVDAFAQRLRETIEQGGQIKFLQIHTIARQTAESWVTPLGDDQLAAIAKRVQTIVTLPTGIYGA